MCQFQQKWHEENSVIIQKVEKYLNFLSFPSYWKTVTEPQKELHKETIKIIFSMHSSIFSHSKPLFQNS